MARGCVDCGGCVCKSDRTDKRDKKVRRWWVLTNENRSLLTVCMRCFAWIGGVGFRMGEGMESKA